MPSDAAAAAAAPSPGTMPPAAPPLTEKQAAEQLGMSRRTLQRMRMAGEGPAYVQVTARRIGYEPGDVLAWRAQRRRGGGAA